MLASGPDMEALAATVMAGGADDRYIRCARAPRSSLHRCSRRDHHLKAIKSPLCLISDCNSATKVFTKHRHSGSAIGILISKTKQHVFV
jgi:hypothetical protein